MHHLGLLVDESSNGLLKSRISENCREFCRENCREFCREKRLHAPSMEIQRPPKIPIIPCSMLIRERVFSLSWSRYLVDWVKIVDRKSVLTI
jgi:hypothetical protein